MPAAPRVTGRTDEFCVTTKSWCYRPHPARTNTEGIESAWLRSWPPTVTPVLVAGLLAGGERMPVYVHLIDHPDARVINTHLHFDHCGGNHLFAGGPIYVQRRELDDARTQDDYTIRDWSRHQA